MTSVGEQTTSADDRPLRKDAARNRQLLLDAGRSVFAEHGLDATLDDIAHEAGVGVGTAYRHFGNKYELARAIFAEAIDAIVALAVNAAEHDDPWTGLVSFLEGAADAQTSDRGLREVLMGAHDADEMERINDLLTGPLNRVVAAAKQSGQLRADAEVSDIGVVVMMLCTIADVMGEEAPTLWRRYLPMLLDGLRPGADLPVPPISQDVLRSAMSSHKQRMSRAVHPR